MNDYLGKMCLHLGIKLIYTNNKVLVLSAQIKDNIPIIRAHKLFKSCPQSIAQSVIGYFTESEGRNIHEQVLEKYLKENYTSSSFRLKPLNLDFKKKVVENIPIEVDPKDDSTLIELDITAMTVKDFWGNEKKHDFNSPLVPDTDEVLELNIIISPPSYIKQRR